jgi:hypothetical protein
MFSKGSVSHSFSRFNYAPLLFVQFASLPLFLRAPRLQKGKYLVRERQSHSLCGGHSQRVIDITATT